MMILLAIVTLSAHGALCASSDRRDISSISINKRAHFAQLLLSSLPAGSPSHRAGIVSIMGVPNVGKSTLMNRLIGERISIATPKAQTTRQSILGIFDDNDHQIVYKDTPGILKPQYKLQEGMMQHVRSSMYGTDIILLLVDIFQDASSVFPDEDILKALRSAPSALLVLLNKVDLLDDVEHTPTIEEAAQFSQPHDPEREARRARKARDRQKELGNPEEIVERWRKEFPDSLVLPISARKGNGVDDVLRRILALLPEHPPYYPKDELTDLPERFFAAEFVREAIFEQYHEEIPYSCQCQVETFKDSEELLRIQVTIFVSQDSQKGIVIGKKGAAVKKLGISARAKLEKFFGKKVYLETKVKVRKNWRGDAKSLAAWGYLQS